MTSKTPPKNDERVSAARRSVRTFTHWSYSKLRNAERLADTGNLSEAAAISEWLLGDDAVAGALSVRNEALFGLEPTFEASGDRRRSARAVKALEAGEDFWRAYSSSELALINSWGLVLGVAPARQVWSLPLPEHDGRVVPSLEFWHPGAGFRYDFQRASWIGRDTLGVEFPITPGDGSWILHARAKNRPWASGLWRELGRWVLFRHLALGDYTRHTEKGAMIVAESSKENTDRQRQKLADDIADSGADAAIVLQSGFSLKFLEISANTKQIYEAQVELANRAIAIRIRGGNLSTNVEGGSKAAAVVQYQAGELPKLRSDADAITTTLHDQSLVWWAEFNYGDRKLAPWPVYPVDPPEDTKAKADTSDKIADAATKFDKLGFEIDEKAFKEEFGLSWLKWRKPPAETPPPPSGDPAAPDAPADNAGAKPPKQEPPKKAGIRLASGLALASSNGFIDGQLYADAVTETSSEHAQKAVQPTLEAILEELDAASDYDDLRERLRARYRDLDPSALSELVYRSMIVADLAGRHAVNQDA